MGAFVSVRLSIPMITRPFDVCLHELVVERRSRRFWLQVLHGVEISDIDDAVIWTCAVHTIFVNKHTKARDIHAMDLLKKEDDLRHVSEGARIA